MLMLTVVTSRLQEDSIDTVDFTREGMDIHEGREVAIMKSTKVDRIITEDVDFISEKANVNQLLAIFSMSLVDQHLCPGSFRKKAKSRLDPFSLYFHCKSILCIDFDVR